MRSLHKLRTLTPVRLTKKEHPRRYTVEEALRENMSALDTLTELVNIGNILGPNRPRSKRFPSILRIGKIDEDPFVEDVFAFSPHPTNADTGLIHVHPYKSDKLLLIFMDGTVVKSFWKPSFSRAKVNLISTERSSVTNLPFLFSHQIDVCRLHSVHAVSDENSVIFSGGQWDDSLFCSNINTGAMVNQPFEHTDTISCVCISEDATILATGSLDCTCLIWDTRSLTNTKGDIPKPRLMLCGHDRAIKCVELSVELDLVITGSDDCTCILYDLSKGSYLRTITHHDPVLIVKVSIHGIIVSYCESINFNELYVHSINGKRILCTPTRSTIYAMVISDDGEYVVTAGESGNVCVHTLYMFSLKVVAEWKFKAKVLSLAFVDQGYKYKYLCAGLDTGELRIIRFDPERFKN